ncbi:sigma-54 dependent transcriptional regulator [bacterium]|nr:sigma-54 dependent transcriptional regulator [bacterium]MBU1064197.1 sigma-54 dependent transcriptional regulator [bacterium]MBU1633732.1 sigma-54 dependent transcriptional regulator [bacterium]MBU1874352.1 sigma-54 dependent transcriptional regulator [bacterium]
MNQTILIVDDEESVRYSFKRFLSDQPYHISTAATGVEALQKFQADRYDLVILDLRLPDMSGLEVFQQLKIIDPRVIALIITAHGTTETAIEATKMGAYDYILKPFDIPVMKALIDESINCSRLMHTQVMLETATEKEPTGDRMIGSNPLMQDLYKMIGRVTGSDVNILLRGESGTGKELVARAIYQYGSRASRSFIAVNCAAIPESLLESELFGYEKGAFTGANRRKIGKFEQANGGTIFLDEIGDMTLSTQSKVLRVLQEGRFEHLGGEEHIQVDVRIITATNRNLEKAIEEGRFREDLYYRIKVVTMTLPPLRLRLNDIPDLANYFVNKNKTVMGKPQITLSSDALTAMNNYHWPGNVRELENIVKRAIVLSKSNVISAELITEEFQKNEKSTRKFDILEPCESGLREKMERFNGSLYKEIISETEKTLITHVLKQTHGNRVQAARILGISRVMLHKRIQDLNIEIT